MSSRGLFITVEGIDGCGKSTQARLIAAALEAAGHDVLRLREPGGVKISEQIREILLDPANAEMGDVCELLLYEAARAQLVHQVIRPGARRRQDGGLRPLLRFHHGVPGLCRWFGPQHGVSGKRARGGRLPSDLTLVFDLPVEDALRRRSGREAEDRLELKGLEFQERVAAGFRAVAADEPDRVKLIDAGESIAEVFSGVAAELRLAGLSMSEDDVAAALQACQGKC